MTSAKNTCFERATFNNHWLHPYLIPGGAVLWARKPIRPTWANLKSMECQWKMVQLISEWSQNLSNWSALNPLRSLRSATGSLHFQLWLLWLPLLQEVDDCVPQFHLHKCAHRKTIAALLTLKIFKVLMRWCMTLLDSPTGSLDNLLLVASTRRENGSLSSIAQV